MERVEIKERLAALLENIKKFDAAKIDYVSAKHTLTDVREKPLTAVETYDREHKSEYIVSRIGEEPEKPSKAMVLAVPLYLKKKKEYEEKLEDYQKAYVILEEEYYKKHKDIRDKLDAEECIEKEARIKEAEEVLDRETVRFNELKSAVAAETIISESVKTDEDVTMLVSYFDEGRADTIKEAVNLLYEEKHRQRIEAIFRRQMELSKQMAELARDAIDKAEEAKDAADDAMELAQEAYSLAEEAIGITPSPQAGAE